MSPLAKVDLYFWIHLGHQQQVKNATTNTLRSGLKTAIVNYYDAEAQAYIGMAYEGRHFDTEDRRSTATKPGAVSARKSMFTSRQLGQYVRLCYAFTDESFIQVPVQDKPTEQEMYAYILDDLQPDARSRLAPYVEELDDFLHPELEAEAESLAFEDRLLQEDIIEEDKEIYTALSDDGAPEQDPGADDMDLGFELRNFRITLRLT